MAAAGPLVWCDEAVVTDVVPAARATRSWVLRRQLRSGNSWSRVELALHRSGAARTRARAGLAACGALRAAAGAARWLAGLLGGDLARRAGGLRTLARGTGMLLGAAGYTVVEYRRPSAGPDGAPGQPQHGLQVRADGGQRQPGQGEVQAGGQDAGRELQGG